MQIYHYHQFSLQLLKTYHKKHLVTLKAFQLVKHCEGEVFEEVFMDENIIVKKVLDEYELSFMNTQYNYTFSKTKGIYIKKHIEK